MYDVVIVLGSQVKVVDEGVIPAQHTKFRCDAAGMLWKQGKVRLFVLSGGYNFFITFSFVIP